MNCPVLSVGNLSAGGTGKTPFVLWLAEHLQARGLNPAVLTRGYPRLRRGDPPLVLRPGTPLPAAAPKLPDEAVLFWRAGVAVAAHPNRGRGAAALARSGVEPDVYLLDDGFQHRAIRRDWDLVLVTPRELAAAREAFPAGPLRESWSALARADRIAVTDVAPGEVAALAARSNAELGLPTGAPPLVAGRAWGDLVELTRWQRVGDRGWGGMEPAVDGGLVRGLSAEGQAERNREPDSFVAFSGIANPSSFERLLLERGLDVKTHVIFPDHHRFAVRELRRLARMAANGAALLTTEKDAARIPLAAFPTGLCWVGRTRLVLWRGEAELAAELERVVSRRTT